MKPNLFAVIVALLLSSHAMAKSDQCGEYTSVEIGEATVDMGKKTTFVHFRSSKPSLPQLPSGVCAVSLWACISFFVFINESQLAPKRPPRHGLGVRRCHAY